MDFEKVTALLDEGNIEGVKTALSEFKPQFEKTVGDLKAYEGKFNEAVQTRDKAKGKLKEISSVFGVDSEELTTDKLKELIKTAKGDDASKAEIANLQKLLEQTQNDYTQKLGDSENKFKDKLIELEIAKIQATQNLVDDQDAVEFLLSYLKKGTHLDSGEIVYRDEDGTITRNPATGRPLTIAEKMAQVKATKPFLFKATANGGGGSSASNGGGSGSQNRSKMSHAEKGKFIKEHGEEAFLKLPN